MTRAPLLRAPRYLARPEGEASPSVPAAPICCDFSHDFNITLSSLSADEDDVAPALSAMTQGSPLAWNALVGTEGGSQVSPLPGSDWVSPEGEASPSATAVLSCGDFNVPSGPCTDEDEGGSGPSCHKVPLPAPRDWQRRDPGPPPGLERPGGEADGGLHASPSPGSPKKISVQSQRTPLSSKACAYVPVAAPESAIGTWGRSVLTLQGRFSQAPTTVMMRNLPYCYTRQMLIDLLDSKGFSGKYDFLYLPFDFESGCHVGYAHVNMTTSEHAVVFMEVFNGFNDWTPTRDNKICVVSWGLTQGFCANAERFAKNHLVVERLPEEYKPIMFMNGLPIPLGTRAREPGEPPRRAGAVGAWAPAARRPPVAGAGLAPGASKGSVGHPELCAGPCKFFWKGRGCLDGDACARCHTCVWRRACLRNKPESKLAGTL